MLIGDGRGKPRTVSEHMPSKPAKVQITKPSVPSDEWINNRAEETAANFLSIIKDIGSGEYRPAWVAQGMRDELVRWGREVRDRTREATRHETFEEALMKACVHCFPRIAALEDTNANR